MADLEQDALLVLDVLHLLQPNDVGHGEDFHRTVCVRLLVAAEADAAECASTWAMIITHKITASLQVFSL